MSNFAIQVVASLAMQAIASALADPIKNEQPIGDLTVSRSQYGVGIPVVYGTARIAGNLIDAIDLEVVQHTETVGGKGGPEVQNTTNEYFFTGAVLLCKGKIKGVRKIFANGELEYDVSDTNAGSTGTSIKPYVKFYLGDENQLPDPTLEAIHGVGNVPAYNGYAIAVFNRLPVTKWGGRLPNLIFEVTTGDAVESDYFSKDTYNNDASTRYLQNILTDNGYTYVLGTYGPNGTQLLKIDEENNLEDSIILQGLNTTIINHNNYASVIKAYPLLNADGDILVNHTGFSSTIDYRSYGMGWLIIDKDTLQVKKVINNDDALELGYRTFDNGSSYPTLNAAGRLLKYNYAQDYISIKHANISGYGYGLYVCRLNDGYLKSVDYIIENLLNNNTYYTSTIGGQYCLHQQNKAIYYVSKQAVAQTKADIYLSVYNINLSSNTTFYKLIEVSSDIVGIWDMYADELNNKIWFSYKRGTDTQQEMPLLGYYDIDTDTFALDIIISTNNWIFSKTLNYNEYYNSFIFVEYDNNITHAQNIIMYNLDGTITTKSINLTQTNNYLVDIFTTYLNDCGYDNEKDIFMFGSLTNNDNSIIKYHGNRLSAGQYNLKDCVDEINEMSGVILSEIDTTDLSPYSIKGFVLSNPVTARAALEYLENIYNFSSVESDWILKYEINNKASVKTIDYTELSAKFYDSNTNFDTNLKTIRQQEQELPYLANLNYLDQEKDYQTNTQESKRQIVRSDNIYNVEIPIVLNATEAKQTIDRLMYNLWTARNKYSFETNYDYIEVEPNDVITINTETQTFKMKITKKDDEGGVLKYEAQGFDADNNTQYSVGETGLLNSQTINSISNTNTYFMDLPIMQDSDDDGGLYVAASKANSNQTWNGSALFTSESYNGSYIQKEFFNSSVTTGTCIDILGSVSTNYNDVDCINTVTVKTNGNLSSCTYDELLNFSNLAVIGDEIIQFMNATLVDTNTYLLTNLLRGRFGTEYNTTHSIGDKFVLVNYNKWRRIEKNTSNIDTKRYYKNVSVGKFLNETSYKTFTNTARGLKEYACYDFFAYKSAATYWDWVCTFKARSRGNNLLKNTVGSTDLNGETTFEVEIYGDANYTQLRRTYFTNSEEFIYSSEDQIIDVGSNTATFYVRIYKTNNKIGRGNKYDCSVVSNIVNK